MCNNLFLCTDLLRLISIQCTSVIWFFFLQFRIKEKSLHMFVYFKLSCHRILNSQSMYTASEMKQINHLNVWLLRWESTTNWFELREKDVQPVRLVAVKYQYRAICTFFLMLSDLLKFFSSSIKRKVVQRFGSIDVTEPLVRIVTQGKTWIRFFLMFI